LFQFFRKARTSGGFLKSEIRRLPFGTVAKVILGPDPGGESPRGGSRDELDPEIFTIAI
jgi:hypothetical protein